MSNPAYQFEVVEPEYPEALVSAPQMTVFKLGESVVKVVVYFMANNALNITGGHVQSAMGKVTLQYSAESPSGAYTASVSLRKIIYTFPNAKGMARNFEFNGQKT